MKKYSLITSNHIIDASVRYFNVPKLLGDENRILSIDSYGNLGYTETSGGGSLPQGTEKDTLTWDSNGNPIARPITAKQLTDINGLPGFPFGVLAGASLNTETPLLLFTEATSTPKSGTIPLYTTNGRLQVSNAVVDGEAVNLSQIPKPSTVLPIINGTAAIGVSALYSRQDHVHPLQTSVATLTTGRTFSVSGAATGTSTSFNGSANVTIPVVLAVPTTTVRGGVLMQPAISNLTGESPTVADINNILNTLRSAGLIAN